MVSNGSIEVVKCVKYLLRDILTSTVETPLRLRYFWSLQTTLTEEKRGSVIRFERNQENLNMLTLAMELRLALAFGDIFSR